MAATRSRLHGLGAARSGKSLGNLVKLDLVPERIHHIRPAPTWDRVGVFKERTGDAELGHGRIKIVNAEGEVSPRVKAQLTVGGEMDMTGRGRIPNARAVAKSDRPFQFVEPEGLSVELPSSGFLARRIEHLGVMQGNPHKIESRGAEIQCFSRFLWATIYSTRRRC
jgi:hypothetical protein